MLFIITKQSYCCIEGTENRLQKVLINLDEEKWSPFLLHGVLWQSEERFHLVGPSKEITGLLFTIVVFSPWYFQLVTNTTFILFFLHYHVYACVRECWISTNELETHWPDEPELTLWQTCALKILTILTCNGYICVIRLRFPYKHFWHTQKT